MLRKIAIYLVGIILSVFLLFFHPQNAFADSLGTWSSTTSLPTNIASHISTFEEGKVFVFGGANVDDYSDALSSTPNSDGTLPGWTLVSNLPETRYWGALVKKEKRIYILGGAMFTGTTNYKNTVYSSTIQSGGSISSWQSFTPLPENRALGNGVVVGERIYYAGGFNNSGTRSEIYYADINENGTIGAWTTSAVSLPEPLSGFGMVEHENNIIVFGGETTGGIKRNKSYKASVNPADGSLSIFTTTSELPEAVYRGPSVKVGSTIISIGGYNGLNFLNKVYYTQINPDGTLDAWNMSSNLLPEPVCCAGVAVFNNFVYLTGGFNGAYLNTVYYAPLNISDGINLPVPYYSQNDDPWGPTEYDHANSLGFSDPDFERWGCAVTSAAMILNYHGMTEFEDETPIDPGTLNEWLKNNNGFQTNKPGFGKPFSKFVWSSINKFTEELYEASKSAYKLEHIRYDSASTESSKLTVLNDDLTNKQNPAILAVSNVLTDMHFVVAKGIATEGAYFINDPEWNYENLAPFGNDFFQLDRYRRATSNASYIEMSTNEGIEIAVVNSEGKKTGKQVIGGVVETFDEIPNAIYSHQNPISNPNASNEKANLGFGFNEFLLPEPIDGSYKIILSSFENQTYTLNIATLQANGDDNNFQMTGIIDTDASDEFELNYSQSDPSALDEIVTFDSLINDIRALRATGDINNLGVYISLLTKAKVAKGLSMNVWTKKASVNLLMAMQKQIMKQKGKGLSENAFNILDNDIQALIETFN